MCPFCYQNGGSLLHCLSTLTSPQGEAVYFCCTGLGVASTGRYPASCPVKPGLSSSAPFRLCSRDHLSWLRKCYSSMDLFLSKELIPFCEKIFSRTSAGNPSHIEAASSYKFS